MKVGIVVFSQTGNTFSVAGKLKEKLTEAGHDAEIQRVTITGEATPGSKNFQLNDRPDLQPYDAVVFAAPVQAFSLCSAMAAYLEQLPALQRKKVACFVTKQLPGKWTGGKRAVGSIKKFCEAKGGNFLGSEIIVWSKQREKSIEEAAGRLARLF